MGTTVTAQMFMANSLKVFFRKSLIAQITNRDYYTDGDVDEKTTKSIRAKNQKFTISTLYSGGWATYSGSTLSWNTVKEVVSTLTIDTFKTLNDLIPSLSYFKSSVKDPKSSLIEHAGGKLRELVDQLVLDMVADAGAGNWVGTSYVTGTVAVATSTGVVTGSGTTFTSGMVGKPFKAAGHSVWYRVKTYTSATSITIENDSDDEASAYDGGAISAGAAYEIQANTKIALTKTNIAQYFTECQVALDNQAIPEEDRWMVLPASAKKPLHAASEFNKDLEKVFGDVVVKGVVQEAAGFKLYYVPDTWVNGDNTSGYECPFGHKSFITAGYGFIEPISIILSKDNQTNYGDMYKGLYGIGLKVADERRKAGGKLFATFSIS